MRFASLGSGSAGNATLVASADACVLLDCGFTVRELERRLASLDVAAQDLAGILLTHEHSDHASGVAALARRYRLPVWMTHGTHRALRDQEFPDLRLMHAHGRLRIGSLLVQAFPVPHDAAEPCQFVFAQGAARLGVLTDTGCITAHIAASLDGCQALILECNHDAEMLRTGPYPARLQARVGGPFGHLENRQSAALLARIEAARLQWLLLAHISRNNNTAERALAAVCDALACDGDFPRPLAQDRPSQWYELA